MTDDVTGRDMHPDLDRLADLDAGVDVDRETRSHASTCPECQQTLAALRATRADLAALPVTSMPADVAARIDAALEQESAQDSPAHADSTVVAMTDLRARKRRSSFMAGGVAASVVVLLVAVIVLSSISGGHKSNGGSASGAGSSALGSTATQVVTVTGRNYTQKNLDSTVAALLHGQTQGVGATAGAPMSGTTGGTSGAGPAVPANPSPKAARNQDHTTTAFGAGVTIPPQLRALQTDPNAMTQCINSLLGSPPYVAPLAVDLATYDGKSAAIFVFPKANDPAHVRVYVVPPGGCANGFFEFYKNSVPR